MYTKSGTRSRLPDRPTLAHIAALVTLTLACFGAATAGEAHDADARYQKEKAVCLGGGSHQDRVTCMKEADAALAESKTRQALPTQANYDQHALIRCKALPADERTACRRRIEGEGSSSGSVEGGGVLRTIVTPDETKPDSARPDETRPDATRQEQRPQ